jgi:hypothetical protein
MPYYWLTNFYYNEESQRENEVIGSPQYPINAKLPLQSKKQAERFLPFDENGEINKEVCYFISFGKGGLVSRETNYIFPRK